jgi:hypothetical protein
MDQQPASPFGSIIGSLSWDCQYQAASIAVTAASAKT